jgi:predicted porin
MNLQGDSMKKSLIALAVAGAFAAPSAMAVEFTPTLYQSLAFSFDSAELNGVTDVGSADGQSVRSGGGSTIGFKFTDDLGNGMTAEAFVHITTNIPKGNDSQLAGRNGYVGLSSGSWGSVKLGANEHVYEVGQIIDGWGSDWFGGGSVGFFTSSPTRLGLSGWNFTRQDLGSLWWTSPSWGGFVLDVAYIAGPAGALDTINNVTDDAEGVQLGGKWSNSAFLVSAAYASYENYGLGDDADRANGKSDQYGGGFKDDQSGKQDAKGLRLTFVWTAGWGNLGVNWNTMESEDSRDVAGTKNEADTWMITGTFNLASGRIIANYNQAGDQDYGGVSVADSGAQGFDLAYQHDLSASSYAFVRWESNKADNNYQFDQAGTVGNTALGKLESDSFMLGMKVSY